MNRPALQKNGSFKDLSQYMRDIGKYCDQLESENKRLKYELRKSKKTNSI